MYGNVISNDIINGTLIRLLVIDVVITLLLNFLCSTCILWMDWFLVIYNVTRDTWMGVRMDRCLRYNSTRTRTVTLWNVDDKGNGIKGTDFGSEGGTSQETHTHTQKKKKCKNEQDSSEKP